MRKDIIGFFEKGTFLYKGNVFKIKEEESEEESEENKLEKKMAIKNLSNILRMNQKALTMIFLNIILIL